MFVNCFGNNDEIFWSASMLQLNMAGIQYALGDLKADDTLIPDGVANLNAEAATRRRAEAMPAAATGLRALWWSNNSFTGDPVLTNVVNRFNPLLNSPAAPFPASKSEVQ